MSLGVVIQIIDSLNVGGAEVTAVNIANALSQEGVNSHLCVTRKKGELENRKDRDVNLLFLNRKKVLDIKSLKLFLNYTKKNSIDTIHAHSSSIFFAIQAKLLRRSFKVIWHDHYGISPDYSKRPTFLLKICSYYISTILSVNSSLQNWAKTKLACKEVIYLPNFAELNNQSNHTTILKGEEGKRIIMIAGLRPQKDYLNLLKAFTFIHKEFPDWSLHIVGKDYNDDYSKEIHSFIKHNKLDKIYFYGVKNDISNILSQVDIAVLSSVSEGLPISLLEYGLSKTPTVCTNVGQCKEVVNNSDFVVEKSNEKLLSEAIKKLIKDEDLRRIESLRLFERVDKNFSKKTYLKKIKHIYKHA